MNKKKRTKLRKIIYADIEGYITFLLINGIQMYISAISGINPMTIEDRTTQHVPWLSLFWIGFHILGGLFILSSVFIPKYVDSREWNTN